MFLHLIKTSEGATSAIRLSQSIKSKYNDITFSVVIPANGKHYDEYKSVYEYHFYRSNINAQKRIGARVANFISGIILSILRSPFSYAEKMKFLQELKNKVFTLIPLKVIFS